MMSPNKTVNFNQKILEATTPLPGSTPYTSTYKLTVKLKDDGLTLLELYQKKFPHIDQSIWIEKIENGDLTVNHQKSSANQTLKAGWITYNNINNKTEPEVSNNIELLYEDEDILVINKPAPLPVHPSGRFNKNTLTHFLKLAFPNQDYKIIHRLDANTTGIMILGKNNEIVNQINKQFEQNTTQKTYLAIVEGKVNKDAFKVESKIGEEKIKSGSRILSEQGQTAETYFEKLNIKGDQTLLKITPKSGRTNQIRIHLASVNHPILGDFGYKDPDYFKDNPLTYPSDCLFLHAWKLKINYKGSDKQFIANIPEKFYNIFTII